MLPLLGTHSLDAPPAAQTLTETLAAHAQLSSFSVSWFCADSMALSFWPGQRAVQHPERLRAQGSSTGVACMRGWPQKRLGGVRAAWG